MLLRSLQHLRAGVLRVRDENSEASNNRGAWGVAISRLIDKINKQTEKFNSFSSNIRINVFLQTFCHCLKFFVLIRV